MLVHHGASERAHMEFPFASEFAHGLDADTYVRVCVCHRASGVVVIYVYPVVWPTIDVLPCGSGSPAMAKSIAPHISALLSAGI